MNANPETRIEIPATLQTAAELHAFLQQALGLPAHYGHNLDALWDCATGEIARPVCLVWPARLTEQAEEGPALEKILAVLQEAAQENPSLRIEVVE